MASQLGDSTVAQFNPPDSHWAEDFDARLVSTFHYLKDRIETDEAKFAEALDRIEALVAEAKQYVTDARYWAERSAQ